MDKKTCLRQKMSELAREDMCIAFSGGVDSSLILVMACEAASRTGSKILAVTMDTVLHPKADLDTARAVVEGTGAEHFVVHIDELADVRIKNNPRERCYLCKKALYTEMKEFARKKNISVLIEGTNEDDLHVYRPGLKAVRELGVHTPLADCGITKKEVRELAAEYGIFVAERPSAPCLATRLPYGTEIDLKLLKKIDRGEELLRSFGFGDVRIRVHGEILRLEVKQEDFPEVLRRKAEILKSLKEIGCPYITLDMEGFRSGSMDIV